jgi:hypothetical protein
MKPEFTLDLSIFSLFTMALILGEFISIWGPQIGGYPGPSVLAYSKIPFYWKRMLTNPSLQSICHNVIKSYLLDQNG